MIAQPTLGNYLKGLITYNEEKVAINDAKFLFANNLTNSVRTFEIQYKNLLDLSQKKDNLLHVSLNFHSSDRPNLTEENLINITKDFLAAYGVPHDHPFLIYQHFDKEHPHVHVITPLRQDDDKAIPTHNNIPKFMKICRDLEKKYSLTQAAKGKRQDVSEGETRDFNVAYQAIEYGLRRAMKAKPENLKELEKQLEKTLLSYNGELCRVSFELSTKFNGITYFITTPDQETGQYTQVTRGVKGSKVPGFSHPKLQVEFAKNSSIRKKRSFTVQQIIKGCLSVSKGFNHFNETLEKNKIKPTYFFNKNKEIFGVEFRDLATDTPFKGSELGSDFSWNVLKKNFRLPAFSATPDPVNFPIPELAAVNLFFEDIPGIKIKDIEGNNTQKQIFIDFSEAIQAFEKDGSIYNTLLRNLGGTPLANPKESDLIELLQSAFKNANNEIKTFHNLPATQERAVKTQKPLIRKYMNASELKDQINIIDLADHIGYSVVAAKGKENVSKWVTLQKGADKDYIIVAKNGSNYNYYKNPDNPDFDKGSVLDLLVNKKIVEDISGAVAYLNKWTNQPLQHRVSPPRQTPVTKIDPPKPFIPITSKQPVTQSDYIIKGHGNSYSAIRQYFPEYVTSIDHETLRKELTKLYGPEGSAKYMPTEKPENNYNVFPIFDINDPTQRRIVGQEVINKGFKHLINHTNKDTGAWFTPKDGTRKGVIVTESPSKYFAYATLTNDRTSRPFATLGTPSEKIINYLASLSAAGEKVILGGDNDSKGQFFNFRIASKIVQELQNATISPSIFNGPSGREFRLTLWGNQGPDFTLNNKKNLERVKTLATRTGAHIDMEPTPESRASIVSMAILKFPLSGNESADSEKINTLLKEFIYLYDLNTSVVKPILKDFNDDLLARQQPKSSIRHNL